MLGLEKGWLGIICNLNNAPEVIASLFSLPIVSGMLVLVAEGFKLHRTLIVAAAAGMGAR